MKTNRRFLTAGTGSEGGPAQTLAGLMAIQSDEDIPQLEELDEVVPEVVESEEVVEVVESEEVVEEVESTDPAEETTSADVLAYWAQVEELSGLSLELTDEEVPTDLDPANTARIVDIVHRNSLSMGAQQFENFLQTTHPKAYNYFVFLDAGGDPDEFFEQAPKSVHGEQVVKENIDLQKSYITNYLKEKNLGQSEIDTLISTYAVDGLLETKGLEARKHYENVETQFGIDQQDAQAASVLRKQKAESGFISSVDNLLKTGKIGTLAIPEADRVTFAQALVNSIDVTADGRIFLKTEVNTEDFANILAKEYIGFKKGDLSSIVNVKAKTEATKSLKLRMQSNSKIPNSSAQASTSSKGVGSLMSLMTQLTDDSNT